MIRTHTTHAPLTRTRTHILRTTCGGGNVWQEEGRNTRIKWHRRGGKRIITGPGAPAGGWDKSSGHEIGRPMTDTGYCYTVSTYEHLPACASVGASPN